MENQNPYAAPAVEVAQILPMDNVAPTMVRRYRSELRALGILWILFGIAFLLVAAPMYHPLRYHLNDLIFLLFSGLGIGFAISGLLSLFRIEKAMRCGLVLSYFSLLIPGLWFSIVGVILIGAAILQAHRVLKWVSLFRRAGLWL